MLFSSTFKDGEVLTTTSVLFFVFLFIGNVTAKAYHDTGSAVVDVSSTTSVNPLLPDRKICGESTDDKIIGGTVTSLDEFPWLVLLQYIKADGKKDYYCGGALISHQYILTAAHCLVGPRGVDRPKLISVRLGEWDLETDIDCQGEDCIDPPQDIGVESFLVHENYNRAQYSSPNDIGLVRMKRPVEYTLFVSPICLPLIDEEVNKKSYVGKELVVAGWGKTEKTNHSTKKLKVNLPVIEASTCASKYKAQGVNLSDTQFCAGGKKDKDSCTGDSGGPIVVKAIKGRQVNWFATGLVSFGPKDCGTEGFPGVYTNVSNFGQWISDNVKP